MLDEFDRLDRLAESADYAIVGPVDSRVHLIHTTRFPYATLCHLGRDFGDGLLRGCSGVLIGPRQVLTAAHCLYSLKLGRAPQRVRVAPGRADRDRFPLGTVQAARGYVPRRFVEARTTQERRVHDYGLLTLPRPFAGAVRFMPLIALSDAQLDVLKRQGTLTVAGYPGDRPVGSLWGHREHLRRYTPRRLLYSVDTCPGHSGSAIWARWQGRRALIGVHTSGILDERGRSYGCAKGTVMAPPGMLNSGVRLTAEVIANLRDPQRRVGGVQPMLRVL